MARGSAGGHFKQCPHGCVPRFRRFGDSALEYDLLCWVRCPTRASKATHHLNRAIYARLADRDIDIPVPQVDVHLSAAGADLPQPESGVGSVSAADD